MEVDVPAVVTSLSAALTRLEAAFEPLANTNLKDILNNDEADMQMDPIEQARTQILTAYLVHDLIWMYLKTSGVEPETHPVMAELARVKSYFGKLKSAEAPPAQRLQIDKDAARRFITGALGSSRAKTDPFAAGAADAGPSGTHTRFDAPAAAVAAGTAEVDSEMEVTEVRDGVAGEGAKEDTPAKPTAGGAKGKAKRPKMDPFAGYDSPKPSPAATKKPKKAGATPTAASPASKSPAPPAAESPALSKHQRKKLEAEKRKAGAGAKHAEE